MGIESDRLVYDYLSQVGDLAQQYGLPSRDRMRLVATVRSEIEQRRAGAGAAGGTEAGVKRILGRLGTPAEVVARAGGAVPPGLPDGTGGTGASAAGDGPRPAADAAARAWRGLGGLLGRGGEGGGAAGRAGSAASGSGSGAPGRYGPPAARGPEQPTRADAAPGPRPEPWPPLPATDPGPAPGPEPTAAGPYPPAGGYPGPAARSSDASGSVQAPPGSARAAAGDRSDGSDHADRSGHVEHSGPGRTPGRPGAAGDPVPRPVPGPRQDASGGTGAAGGAAGGAGPAGGTGAVGSEGPAGGPEPTARRLTRTARERLAGFTGRGGSSGRGVPGPRKGTDAGTGRPLPASPPHLAGEDELSSRESDPDWWRTDPGPFAERRESDFGAVDGFSGGIELPELLKPPQTEEEAAGTGAGGVEQTASGAGAAAAPARGGLLRRALRRRGAGPRRRRPPPVRTGAAGGGGAAGLGLMPLVAVALLATGAVIGHILVLAAGWLVAYYLCRLPTKQAKLAVLVLPGLVASAAMVWVWGRLDGRWGEPIPEDGLGDVLKDTWPVVVRVAAAASALYLLWRARRRST
ncbi:hypothetical protein IHE55_16955 [Streptomyces pactum]|uniref:Integral membrane protein n=1 Tax=Streptomyces pactum TaxID=68249 RepID=A0ABS0NME0_9ACTN|nr:hypothetical protein [Streptomyces pactum]MBH5336374.1 hypothetical protein [Streptomyces pactum]